MFQQQMENFSQPQRQSKIGIIAHFLYALQKLLRAFVPLLIIILLKAESQTRIYVIVGSVFLCVLLLVMAYLNFKNFYFYIRPESNEFIVEKGVFNRSKIMIQLEKIQQVNINQSFVQKLVGVFAVEIDSAGGSGKEVMINSVSYEVAIALKRCLLEHTVSVASDTGADLTQTTSDQNTKTSKISMGSLIKVGLTSRYIQTFLIILLFLNTIYEQLTNYLGDRFELDPEQMEAYVNQYWIGYVILFFAVLSILSVLIINLIRILYKFYNFTIIKESNSLLLSFGLLATRSTIIRPNRVQVIKTVQNYFQKRWDILQIHIRQVAGEESDKQNKKSALEIPGCSAVEKEDLFQMIYGQQPVEGVALKSSNRFFWTRFFFFGLLPIVLFLLFFRDYIANMEWYAVLPLYLILVSGVSYRMYRLRTLYIHPKFIVIKKGFWDISREIIEPYKIQKIETTQFFWQRTSDIGGVSLYTAGGVLRFNSTKYSEIKKYVDYWLFQIETSTKNWM